jgi:UrcA family protein
MFKSPQILARTVALLVLPALFMAESAVAAVAAQVPPSVTVRYSDLNLDSTAGISSLYTRIQDAATEACRPVEGPQSVSRTLWTAWNKCFHHAIADAVRAVHNDKLSAYHWQRDRGWGYPEGAAPTTVARR